MSDDWNDEINTMGFISHDLECDLNVDSKTWSKEMKGWFANEVRRYADKFGCKLEDAIKRQKINLESGTMPLPTIRIFKRADGTVPSCGLHCRVEYNEKTYSEYVKEKENERTKKLEKQNKDEEKTKMPLSEDGIVDKFGNRFKGLTCRIVKNKKDNSLPLGYEGVCVWEAPDTYDKKGINRRLGLSKDPKSRERVWVNSFYVQIIEEK